MMDWLSAMGRMADGAVAGGRGVRGAADAKGLILPPDARIHYAYSTLEGVERRAYEDICEALIAGKSRVTVRGLASCEGVFRVVRMVRADHPEVHWFGRGARISSWPGRAEVLLDRCEDAHPGDDEALMAAAAAFERSLPPSADEYLVAKAAFSQVAGSTRYDHATAELDSSRDDADMRPYEATGALVDHRAVCSGFAKATQFLLQRCGIMAVLLSGEARAADGRDESWGAHAWLAVRIDGRFYHMDPTWTSMGRDDDGLTPEVRFDYFGLTDREIARTHRATSCPFTLPVCDSAMAEYYRREGLCLHAWDEVRYADMVCRQLASGGTTASVKAANDATYRKMVDGILHSGGWQKALRRVSVMCGRTFALDKVSFLTDSNLRTLTLLANEAA